MKKLILLGIVLLLIPMVYSVESPNPSDFITDNWDRFERPDSNGFNGNWTESGNYLVNTSIVFEGSQSIQSDGGTTDAIRTSVAVGSNITCSVYMYVRNTYTAIERIGMHSDGSTAMFGYRPVDSAANWVVGGPRTDSGVAINFGSWNEISIYHDGAGGVNYFLNGTIIFSQAGANNVGVVWIGNPTGNIQYPDEAQFDKYRCWKGNYSHKPQLVDTTPPSISSINCTSCVTDPTPDAEPYITEDTTPTFNFTTNENAWCVIGKDDENYTTMNATNSGTCNTGEGSTGEHICTLPIQDRFDSVGANSVYISCKDTDGNEGNVSDSSKSNSGALDMEITGPTEAGGDDSIQIGIDTSEIGSLGSLTVYSDQQVYGRNLSNGQFTGTFDKLAIVGNKRWALNYVSDGESTITGIFNITPALYVLQLQNRTNESIINDVSAFINSTYP